MTRAQLQTTQRTPLPFVRSGARRLSCGALWMAPSWKHAVSGADTNTHACTHTFTLTLPWCLSRLFPTVWECPPSQTWRIVGRIVAHCAQRHLSAPQGSVVAPSDALESCLELYKDSGKPTSTHTERCCLDSLRPLYAHSYTSSSSSCVLLRRHSCLKSDHQCCSSLRQAVQGPPEPSRHASASAKHTGCIARYKSSARVLQQCGASPINLAPLLRAALHIHPPASTTPSAAKVTCPSCWQRHANHQLPHQRCCAGRDEHTHTHTHVTTVRSPFSWLTCDLCLLGVHGVDHTHSSSLATSGRLTLRPLHAPRRRFISSSSTGNAGLSAHTTLHAAHTFHCRQLEVSPSHPRHCRSRLD